MPTPEEEKDEKAHTRRDAKGDDQGATLTTKGDGVSAKRNHESDSGSESDDDDHVHDLLEEGEATSLKEDLGSDFRLGKRVKKVEQQDTSRTSEGASVSVGEPEHSEDIWKSLQEERQPALGAEKVPENEEMVKIKQTYRFGREDVTEERWLPRSHPEAKAFLAKQSQTPKLLDQESKPAPPGPRRRKGGSSLAAMSAAAKAKPTKINTLEKSRLDWNQYKETDLDETDRHDLEAQTRGGGSGLASMKGYIGRRDFLERVQDRLGEAPK